MMEANLMTNDSNASTGGASTGQRYKKILVPLDGSNWAEQAIPHAREIARNHSAELILFVAYQKPMHEYQDQMALASRSGIRSP